MQLRYSLILALVLTLLAACVAPAPQPVADAPTQAPATQAPATQAPPTQAPDPTTQPTTAPTDAPSATLEPAPTETAAPAEAPTPTPAEAGGSTPVAGVQVNMDELFPPGEGRELTLSYCMACHSFAPIVMAQKSAGEWNLTQQEHRERMATLSDEEFDLITQYLINTYNRDWQVPELPPELLQGWIDY